MLFTKMDLLNYQYLDKMNNNIGILCYEDNSSKQCVEKLQQPCMCACLLERMSGRFDPLERSPSAGHVTRRQWMEIHNHSRFLLAVARLPLQLFIMRAREFPEHMANLLQLLRAEHHPLK